MRNLSVGLRRQTQVLIALTIREVRLRNSKHAFSQLMDLGEAIIFILVHWVLFYFLHRKLLIGDSLLLFITTGIFPVLFFRTISIRAASAIEASKSVTAIPSIEPIDYSIARTVVEVLAFSVTFITFFATIAFFEISKLAIPYNILALIQFIFLIIPFAFGIGLINSFLSYLFPLWKTLWSFVSRAQIFFSAVFYIPEYMPPAVKEIIAYNPILHFVSLFRTAFYPTYPTHLLSVSYVAWWTAGTLIVGLALERALRIHRHG
ncbi:ABC transporter permease [Neorhizobium sp. IRS_2294]|uniref:ABC transporter permease n=1 Tax=unclassified Neorhizobium TaxID=2629175 RepID=UPI003D298242